MNEAIIHEAHRESIAASRPFPEVVAKLAEAGVESYYADLIGMRQSCWGRDRESCSFPMETDPLHPASGFDAAAVGRAVREIQQRRIGYVEFLRRIAAAGTMGYLVFIAGRKAVYLGRRGESHVEPFPPAAS